MEKMHKKIQCKRRFFVNYFIVSVILMVSVCFIWLVFKHTIYNFMAHLFNITYNEFTSCFMKLTSWWRLLIIQFTLAPAISFYWLEKHKDYKEESYR